MEKTQLPLARTKKIVKSNPEIKTVSGDSITLLTKAVEYIIGFIADESMKKLAKEKRKTIQSKDIVAVLNDYAAIDFLKDAVVEE